MLKVYPLLLVIALVAVVAITIVGGQSNISELKFSILKDTFQYSLAK